MELSERITDLQKVIYGLAVEKNKLDKQARYLVEEIGAEKKRIAEAEHRRLAEAIHLIEKELLALSSNDGTNKELIHKKEMERKVLMDKYATVWSDSVNLVSDDLITLQNSLEEAENRLQQIETEGRAITMNLMSLEEEQKNMEMTNESEKKTDPHKTEDYMFIPTIDKDGIIDYTSVESDKIYLANRKTILSQDYPSYLPPVQIRRNTQYDIPAYKISDNEYLLRESMNPHKDDNGNIIEPKIYRVSLDVYAALINYHLEFDRAAFNAVAKRNEEERLKAVDSGITEYQAIRESSIPELAGKLDVNGLNETYTTRRLDYIYKPSRVALQSVKSRRMNYEPYYFIESMAKKEGKHLSRNEIFQMHRECINNVNQKILDMELQKADFESSWTKGRDTSYGDSNLDLSLLDTHGVRVKRQNGDIITRKEIDEISEAITQVHRMYGDVSQVARNFGLKVSHAGNMKMHASKASGIFTSYQNAIGISFGNGMLQASIIACHEYTHFLDHLSGKERHAWHASDIPGTLENEIAVAFREHMNPVSGDYWNRTCECFARAMEEYAHINILRKANEKPGQTILSDEEINAEISKPAYVPYSAFLKHIVPLADRLIEYYQEKFNINAITQAPVIEQEQKSPATSYSLQENTRDLPNLNANYTQLELFETATEYNSKEHSFFSQLDQYLENGITPRGNIFTLHSTPDILQYGNLTNNPIIIRVAILKKALVKHSLTKDEIRMALRSLSDPVLLFDTNKDTSESKGESVLLLTDSISRNQNPVAIALELNKDSNGQFIHEIRSIHERVLIARNGAYVLDEWIEKGLLKYIDDKKISGWQRRERVYFPMSFAQPDINNLLQDSSFVNKISGENIKSKSLYINALISDHPETYIKEGDAALTREHIRSSKAALRSYTDPVLKGPRNGLWKVFRDFKKHGIFDIQGTQIETTSKGQITSEGWKQLYQATSIYRDKRFETFRMLFVTPDGIVKDQIAISSNLPDRVRVVSLGTVLRNDIFEHATRTNTKIVLVHNHPSGNIEPSDADTYITRQFYEVFQGESRFHPSREAISLNYPPEIAEHMLAGIEESSLVMGHIILDHDSFSLWEPENGWNTIEYLKNNHDPLMKTRNPMFTNFRITGKQALCNAARAINESDRWNSSDWIPVIFTNSSTTINSIRYYSKEWFKRTSSREIQDEFISIGKRTGTVRAFPLLNEEFAGDSGLRECILNHFYNGCFTDYFFAGETAAGTDVFRYGKGIFDSLRDDDISRTDQIDSTITLPFLEERKDDNREQSIVAEAMLHSRPNYKEGMLQYVNDKEKAVELTSTLQVRVKANSIAFNENIHRKSEFVKQCYIRSPQDIYTQNNDQNAVKKEANMEGLEVKDGLAHEGEKRKPYFQLNAEMLLDSIKTEKAPFLAKNVETPTVTLMPQAIRSAATGRTFRGMNQILAQISLKEMGSRDTEIITYKQAKKFEAGIKKGSKGLHLTSYDAEGKKQTAYKYYPFSATYDRNNLPKIPEHTKKPNTVIFANEADPQKYLGKYLAATSLGAKFVTTPETMESFRKRVVEDLEKSFSENRHSKIFELGNKASEICRETMSEIGTRDHTMSRINDSRRNTTMNTTEPYNPVTGEKFLGENAGKAAYLMERRKSKDPRFLEITDLLKAGLSLKEDAKEVLTVSSNGKTRFFYNAIDIEGMPPRNNVQNRAQKQFVANQKQKDLDMSM